MIILEEIKKQLKDKMETIRNRKAYLMREWEAAQDNGDTYRMEDLDRQFAVCNGKLGALYDAIDIVNEEIEAINSWVEEHAK